MDQTGLQGVKQDVNCGHLNPLGCSCEGRSKSQIKQYQTSFDTKLV